MTHVQITAGRDEVKVVIDGVDVTKSVLAEGFGVTFDEAGRKPLVHMTLAPTFLDLGLPDAVLDALRHDSEAVA